MSSDLSNFITNNKYFKEDKWINYLTKSNFNLLNDYSIEFALRDFWEIIMEKLPEGKFIYFLLRIKYEDNDYKTLSIIQKVNKNDFDKIFRIYTKDLNYKSEDYQTDPLEKIMVTYKIISDDKLESKESKISGSKKYKKDIGTFKFWGYNLPNTMDFTQWGKIILSTDDVTIIKKYNSSDIFNITKNKDYNFIQLKDKDLLIFEFYDYFNDSKNLNTFTRIINDQEYNFIDGELITKIIKRKTKFIKSIKTNKDITNNFITLDIETRLINNTILPYALCYFDGNKSFNFYLSDYNNEQDMLKTAVLSLFQKKYHNYIIYVHNLSFFDGIFLIKVFTQIENLNIRPLMKDGKMFNIELKYKKIKINFRDSLLMLPNSLRNLSKQFDVESKGIFPYDFVNIQNNLDYIGKIPTFKYFNDLTQSEYVKYYKSFKNNKWNLKDETLKYCIQDCISLYQVINKFNMLIFEYFNLNIHRFATLSSLALGIYRSNYLKDYKIPIISGKMFNDIRKSYTGGSTEMFIPYGENIYAYDVNSLYPTVMKQQDMPIGNIKYFEGDIRKVDNKSFGFFEVEITAPDNIKHPIIQTKVDTGNGLRTLSPLGTWKDMIFSEEMDNAIKYGYTFKIIRGYLFDKEKIFTKYIDSLYQIKQSHSKDEPMYLISKLLLNSLYGKFGMDYRFDEHLIISDNEINNLVEKNYLISELITLDNDKSLISIDKNIESDESFIYEDSNYNISIGIASAVTAYSRIYMSNFKNKNDYDLYYTDTDSIFINKELSDNFVGKDLGQLKVENIFKEACFLAPKVYGGITINNTEVSKVKGFKNKLKYLELKSLLNKDTSLILKQDKWFKSIEEGNINIKNQIYTLLPTENKRQLMFENNKLINTKSFKIKFDQITSI